MKILTKLVALLLTIVTLMSTAVACSNGTPSDTTGSAVIDTTTPTDTTGPLDTTDSGNVDTTAPDTDDTTAPPVVEEIVTPETITIEKEGSKLNYIITRPKAASSDAIELLAAQQLLMYFSEKIGARASIGTDWAKEENPERLEIIVGATDHPETQEVLEDMSYGDCAVRAVGNKIIVIAFDKTGYDKAVSYLEGVLDRGYDEDSKTITVKTSRLDKIESTSRQLSALPVYESGKYYATYDAGRVTVETYCKEIIVKETTSEEYDEYLEKLSAKGYTEYTTNNVGNNKFAIYTNKMYTLNVGYYDYEKSVRLLVEPKGALPARAEDNNTKKIIDSQITMIAVASGNSNIGLSMLIRLEDGRFIVVDGAGSGNSDHFIKTIKAQAYYTERPVVAAWIITHGHDDHALLLAKKYSSIKSAGITVESIIMNEVTKSDSVNSNYLYGTTGKILGDVAMTFGADIYKPHVGQAFHISNCKMEVMFTQEAYAPQQCVEYNSTSIVLKMTFTDSKTGKQTTYLCTGDATGFGMQTANNIFGDYMKCDIINVNHHGLGCTGGNTELAEAYKVVSPALVLWPLGNGGLGITGDSFNRVLFESSSFKELYFSGNIGDGDVLVPLPYVPGTVKRE